jgi:hypothetical protein
VLVAFFSDSVVPEVKLGASAAASAPPADLVSKKLFFISSRLFFVSSDLEVDLRINNTLSALRAAHELYFQLTGQKLSLRFDRERLWDLLSTAEEPAHSALIGIT